jgi:hypothetical protein
LANREIKGWYKCCDISRIMRYFKTRNLCLLILTLAFLALLTTSAFAIPTLQLDIKGGTYDQNSQTIIASGDAFSLYAYLYYPDEKDREAALKADYFLSMALSPAVAKSIGGYDFGSFAVNGNTIKATSDMTYGIPPFEVALDKAGLPPHGIFPTYYYENKFKFTGSQVTAYDTQSSPGSAPQLNTSSGKNVMFFEEFGLNINGLSAGEVIHFDLYTVTDGKLTFAPFSHDAESSPKTNIPEPTTLILLGSGLVGLYPFVRKKFHRKTEDQEGETV